MGDNLQDQWVMVPPKATSDMQIKGLSALDDSDATPDSIGQYIGFKAMREVWQAMLAAAPQQAPTAPSPYVEAQARELLAAEYERNGHLMYAKELRFGGGEFGIEMTVRAITAALRQPVQAAPGVIGVVTGEFVDCSGEKWFGVDWSANPEVGTPLYAAPHATPEQDDYPL